MSKSAYLIFCVAGMVLLDAPEASAASCTTLTNGYTQTVSGKVISVDNNREGGTDIYFVIDHRCNEGDEEFVNIAGGAQKYSCKAKDHIEVTGKIEIVDDENEMGPVKIVWLTPTTPVVCR